MCILDLSKVKMIHYDYNKNKFSNKWRLLVVSNER